MKTIKKAYGTLFFAVLLFYGTSIFAACPCFNPVFLQSIFKSNKTASCDIYKKGSNIYKIKIYDDKYIAATTSTNCMLNSEHHDVFVDFYSDYHGEHHACIRVILDTCKRLKENVIIRDF